MKVNVYMTITVDPDNYPVPSDGDVGTEIHEHLSEFFYDFDGLSLTKLKVLEKE